MVKHTPGLWWEDDDYCLAAGQGDDYTTIADMSGASPTDREFIVRACNSHDDLLAACKALVASLDWECKRSGTTYAGFEDAQAAIRAAEGE